MTTPKMACQPHIRKMNVGLTDAETAALRTLLRQTIDADRFPLSPRLRPYKAILAKIDRVPPPSLSPLRGHQPGPTCPLAC